MAPSRGGPVCIKLRPEAFAQLALAEVRDGVGVLASPVCLTPQAGLCPTSRQAGWTKYIGDDYVNFYMGVRPAGCRTHKCVEFVHSQ